MAGLDVLLLPAWYPSPAQPMAGVFIRDQARVVAGRHRVVVLVDEGPHRDVRRAFAIQDRDEDGLRVVRVRERWVAPGPAASGVRLLGLAAALARLRRTGFAPDLLHAHTLEAAIPAVALGRAPRLPVVVSEHWSGFLLDALSHRQRTLARRVFAAADVVCPVSPSLRDAIARCSPDARLVVVPNVVDTTRFAPPGSGDGRPQDPPRLLAVGALAEKKGIDVLLDALGRRAAAGGARVQVDVIGDGPDRDALVARAAGLGLGEEVRFQGLGSREDVAAAMAISDVFVLPSRVETFAVALLEALAAGLPVVATRVGVAPEVVIDAVGALVAPGDPDALAAGIDRVLADLPTFARAATKAADDVRERYGPEAIADAWDDVYADVLERRGRV